MKNPVRITLQPFNVSFEVERDTPLQDILFSYGVEFPCGGNAECEGCKVKVLNGYLAATEIQNRVLTEKELSAGWRLSCCCRAEKDVTLELAQWELKILADDSRIEVSPRDGYGIAVDLGTTTVVAQLLDLRTGEVLAVETALNQQGRYGSDVMSRVAYAMTNGGLERLEAVVRDQIREMVARLLATTSIEGLEVRDLLLVGNTVMHHLFCGISVEPLSHSPFHPLNDGMQKFLPSDLGWETIRNASVRFLPCLGGFVGSDVLAGILATRMYESSELAGLIDLGTNGEVVLGNREKLLCCSTAAGPAFEGGQISMGMRSSTGAIAEVTAGRGGFECKTLGNVAPRGICGSGLIDAVALALDMKLLSEGGRLRSDQNYLMICPPVKITQEDIREVQVAKAAIAAAMRILLEELGTSVGAVKRLHLAGAFGNYINRKSACRIGLIDLPPDRVQPAGNTALRGAKLALFLPDEQIYSRIKHQTTHVGLNTNVHFQDIFVDEMMFPPNEEIH
jgi:uncharacterized 2Fe-2S/4Fe-4S cluster protein (DUF4445 family)